MNATRQLYQLQGVELDIESKKLALAQCQARLGKSRAVAKLKAKIDEVKQRLDELGSQQHSAEWEIEGIETKLTAANEAMYSGRVSSPKELSNLQHEVEGLNSRRGQLEEKALDMMEQTELVTADLARSRDELKVLEGKWRVEQRELAIEIEKLKETLTDLEHKRQLMLAAIPSPAADLYRQLREQKGRAVARVDQGICGGCRISLSTSELQWARGNRLVECSSCGRILFLD